MDNSSMWSFKYIGWPVILLFGIFYTHILGVGLFFYKSELPEVQISFALQVILTYKKSPHNFERSKFACFTGS